MSRRPSPHWDTILDAWVAGQTAHEIGRRVRLSPSTVHAMVCIARARGDGRAVRRCAPKGSRSKPRWYDEARAQRERGVSYGAIAARLGFAKETVRIALGENA